MTSDNRPVERQSRLAEWFRELRTPLRRFIARRRGMSRADVDDVAQEVFLRLLRYDRADFVADPRSYLFKMASNVASEWSMRASERFPHLSGWLDDLTDDLDLVSDIERAQRDRQLRAALDLLPARCREVLRLHLGEGLTHESIARQLNISARMVKRDLVNGYAQLRMSLVGFEARTQGAAALGPAAGERE